MPKRIINSLKPKQAMRDLAWLLNSPSLIDAPQAIGAIEFDPLNVSDETRKQLDKFCKYQADHKVGRYFENLVGFWLQHVRRVELVKQGIQLRDNNRTVGEIDFLFRDETGLMTHLETAVKFFLHFPNTVRSHFPGPNATDNFELKTEKLIGRQLAIGTQYYPCIQRRHALMRGIVFYHPSTQAPTNLPSRMSNSHLTGIWIRESELDYLNQWNSGEIASKPYWLSPSIGMGAPMSQLRDAISTHFDGPRFPIMLYLGNGTCGQHNDARMFVVSDSWPS